MRTLLLLLLTPVLAFSQTRSASPRDGYGKLPISFEVNAGQVPAPAKFVARGHRYVLSLQPDGAVLSLADPDSRALHMRMALVGANGGPEMNGEHELPGKVNYLIGNERSRWRTGISTYRQVRYSDVYPGIDLVYYGNQRQLEYDFVLDAGVDPKTIRMTFEGSRSMRIDAGGDLVLDAGEEIRMRKPFAYQERNQERQEVPSRYVLLGDREVGFEVKGYDPTLPLVIDPVLEYSTFIGGTSLDGVSAIAVDPAGSAYIAGTTLSADFPTVSAFQPRKPEGGTSFFPYDAFVAKLNADGTALVYSTYLGGTGAGWTGRESAAAISVTSTGEAIIAGTTSSADFPVVNALQPSYAGNEDAFLAQLNATGTDLVFSTYFGGTGPEDGRDMHVDPTGNILLFGWTRSTDLPTVNAYQAALNGVEGDVFLTSFNAQATAIHYSTYLGGDDVEYPAAIGTDVLGNAYVTGSTESADFPTLNALQPVGAAGDLEDVFVSKFDANGALVYSTYLGGSSLDTPFGIAVDAAGSAHVSGRTQSPDFPLSNPLQPALAAEGYDAFVAKLSPAGTALSYSTYLGGHAFDASSDIAVDATGSAYVVGTTWSSDFPTIRAFQPTLGNVTGATLYDAFVSKLSPDGSTLVYSSYLGSSEKDVASAIAVDASGSAYVVGSTYSLYFPTRNAMQPEMNGQIDAFVTKISDAVIPAITGIVPAFGSPDTVVDVTISGENFVSGATTVSASGTGVSVTNVNVTSPTSLTATFSVSESAVLDARSIRVETPDGASNQMMFMIASAAPACPVSLPLHMKGTVGNLSIHIGIGTTQPVNGNWIMTLLTYDGSTTRFYGTLLYAAELPTINPPITTWTPLPAEIEGNPVVGVINGYFTPDLCASSVAVAPEPASP
jgi:hypothetical protein